jgi:DNA-3-methyladenine glycosylase II
MTMISLNQATLNAACDVLAKIDADLATVLAKYSYPPLWERSASFATLIHIILEQQVSLISARAVFERFCNVIQPLSPENVLNMSEIDVKKIGLTRQKTIYCRQLAQALLSGTLNLETLKTMSDDAAREKLMQVKGIGTWSADVYLLMVLRRPDILPKGDIALYTAAKEIKKLNQRPNYEEFRQMAEAWRPLRAAAARILWHHYLCERGKS